MKIKKQKQSNLNRLETEKSQKSVLLHPLAYTLRKKKRIVFLLFKLLVAFQATFLNLLVL